MKRKNDISVVVSRKACHFSEVTFRCVRVSTPIPNKTVLYLDTSKVFISGSALSMPGMALFIGCPSRVELLALLSEQPSGSKLRAAGRGAELCQGQRGFDSYQKLQSQQSGVRLSHWERLSPAQRNFSLGWIVRTAWAPNSFNSS